MNTEVTVHPKLHHYGLTTANMETMIDWYRKVLGMTINHRSDMPPGERNGAPFSAVAFLSNSTWRETAELPVRPSLPATCSCKKRDRRKAVSRKPTQTFGSSGCALGFFDLDVASDSIEHGELSLLDGCDGIVDGESSVFVQHLGIIRSEFNVQIVLPLGYFRL